MRAIAALALLLAANAHADVCNWNNPGAARYEGRMDQAVDNYRDLPAAVRNELKAKLAKHQFDDFVMIRRDSIEGSYPYEKLRDMHWARGLCKGTVNRSKWDAQKIVGGMVYCSGEHCIVVPSICGNVARLTRLPAKSSENNQGSATGQIMNTFNEVIEAQPLEGGGGSSSNTQVETFASRSKGSSLIEEHRSHGRPVFKEHPVWGGPVHIGHPGWGTGPSLPCPVPAVPEPTSYAMMLAGVAALMFKMKRRRPS